MNMIYNKVMKTILFISLFLGISLPNISIATGYAQGSDPFDGVRGKFKSAGYVIEDTVGNVKKFYGGLVDNKIIKEQSLGGFLFNKFGKTAFSSTFLEMDPNDNKGIFRGLGFDLGVKRKVYPNKHIQKNYTVVDSFFVKIKAGVGYQSAFIDAGIRGHLEFNVHNIRFVGRDYTNSV